MKIRTAFRLEGLTLPLDHLVPTKVLKPEVRASHIYRAVVASLREVAVVEPLMVYPAKGMRDRYMVLDGHLRLEALREIGRAEAPCLVATENETYTYNRHVSRLAPIQRNKMILRAIDEGGVPEQRIANALNVSPKTIRDNRTQLSGICAEAIDLLKDKLIANRVLAALKKVKPLRQIEMAELMIAAGTYTAAYAEAIQFATPREQLVNPPPATEGGRAEDMAKLENEMRVLERDYLVVQESYGQNMVNMTLAKTYLRKLFDNAKVVRWLAQRQGEMLCELQKVVEATSLEG
jgi:ParB-like chromosome segregation protein Spo0J